VGYDAGDGVGQGFVDVDLGPAACDERVDELVRDEGVLALVAGVVPHRFGEHVGLPVERLLVLL